VIHWVSAAHGQEVVVRLYDRLFNVDNPESKEYENYQDNLNPDSLQTVRGAVVEPSALADDGPRQFQFEREGYFVLDQQVSEAGVPVFNRTITLRDSWAK
jgi:glutaminyl-tRNA synthetase